ncbi:hypothetical protein HF086_003321 [Spodoptera exigua]|uniref:Uncharacterized protein n=1 Tax=Spodoptera exigua TaxID=7107 RepID=A0A922MYI5_SPOEX|nr:hypothetical protein HF086_003321 [Spodoptera exigua]
MGMAILLRSYIPYLELAEPEEGYHGLIKENETLVEVTPAIRARGPLCSFLILNNKHHGEAPFEVSTLTITVFYGEVILVCTWSPVIVA